MEYQATLLAQPDNVDDDEYDADYDISNALVPCSTRRDRRVCTWHNYIPHPPPRRPSKELWEESYSKQLHDMSDIVMMIMENKFPGKVDWDKQSIYRNLSTLLYHCSSKHYGDPEPHEPHESTEDYTEDYTEVYTEV